MFRFVLIVGVVIAGARFCANYGQVFDSIVAQVHGPHSSIFRVACIRGVLENLKSSSRSPFKPPLVPSNNSQTTSLVKPKCSAVTLYSIFHALAVFSLPIGNVFVLVNTALKTELRSRYIGWVSTKKVYNTTRVPF